MKMYFIVLVLSTALTSCIGQPPEGVERISLKAMKEEVLGQKVQLVDVRRPDEYAKGYIGDAVNINIADMEVFKTELSKLDKTKPLYLYCHGGKRSNKASKIAKELGFETIYDFSEGWRSWSKEY